MDTNTAAAVGIVGLIMSFFFIAVIWYALCLISRWKVFDKAGIAYKRYVREFRLEDAESYEVKQEIKADIFADGDKVDATAISKGKGYQGAIKRHGQHRGPMAHGSKYHRHAGSNGTSSDPSRVYPGKKMPGHMGHRQVTVQNLEVVRVDAANNLILVKGAVPGPKKSLVTLKETTKSAK